MSPTFARACAAVAALAACAPEERLLVLDAEPGAMVALIALDSAEVPTDVAGPFPLHEIPSVAFSDRAQIVVAFAIEASQHVDLAGRPASIGGLGVRLAPDPARGCTSCTVPRGIAPAIVSPGDSCPPPPFAPHVARALRGDAEAVIEEATIERARERLRIDWPGSCGAAWEPLASERAPIAALCPWIPVDEPLPPSDFAIAADGSLLAMAVTGGAWVRIAPDGRKTRGTADIGLDVVRALTPLPSEPGYWAVATDSPTGEATASVRVFVERNGRLELESSGTLGALTVVSKLRPLPLEPGTFEAVGKGTVSFGTHPLVMRCRHEPGAVRCDYPESVDMSCAISGVGVLTTVTAGRRSVALTTEGQAMIAPADGPARWKCITPMNRLYPVRSSTGTFAVREVYAAFSFRNRVYACVSGPTGVGILTSDMPDAPPGDPNFERDVASLRFEVVKSRARSCRGFVATSSPDVVRAVFDATDLELPADGRVRPVAETSLPELTRAEVQSLGWTVGRDAEYRVRRGRGGATRSEIAVGGAQVQPISAIGVVPEGFALLRPHDTPLLLRVQPSELAGGCPAERAEPTPIPLDGLEAVLTSTGAPLEAWTERDGIWWAWQRRTRSRNVLVRLDLAARKVQAFNAEHPSGFGSSSFGAMAFVSDSEAIIGDPSRGIFRAVVGDAIVTVTSLPVSPWSAEGTLNTRSFRWTRAVSVGDVAWLAADGALVRATSASAELLDPLLLPRDEDDEKPSLRSTSEGLSVSAPNHVIWFTDEVFQEQPLSLSQLTARDLAPVGRPCELARVGAELGSCTLPDSRAVAAITDGEYAAHLGTGPSRDPLLVNHRGLIFGQGGVRAATGIDTPIAIASDTRGLFAVLGPRGHVVIGRREIAPPRAQAFVATPP